MILQNKLIGQNNPLRIFYNHDDIGEVKHEGNVSYHSADQDDVN